METYTVRFPNFNKIVWAIILPPLLIWPFIELMIKYAPNLNEWESYLIIFAFLGLIILVVLYLAIRQSSPIVNVSIENGILQFHFPYRNLWGTSSFEIKVEEIQNFSIEESWPDYYFTIKCSRAPYRFNISADSRSVESAKQFGKLIVLVAEEVDAYNAACGEQRITLDPVKQNWWLQIVMIVAAIILFAMIATHF
jgi:hypothetical protein